MNVYETHATVKDQGRVEVVGVPFAAGSELQITMSLKRNAGVETADTDSARLAIARDRLRQLFADTRGFRNSPRLSREDLYERGRFH